LNDGPAKIGTTLDAAKARMKNAHGLAIRSFQFIPQEPLMLPNCLQQVFGRAFQIFVEQWDHAASHTPFRIKVG
jgi:hypothetical protein